MRRTFNAMTVREFQDLTTEAQLQAWLKLRAAEFGWTYYHTGDSRRSDKGFPDTVLARPGQPVIYAELKSANGRLKPEQRVWRDVLEAATGCEYYVWRPCDMDAIITRLNQE